MKGTKILLAVSGLFAVGVGLTLLLAAKSFFGSQGIVADDTVALVGQAQGSILFGLGVVNFLGLRCSDARGLQALCGGNFAAHVAGLGVNVHAISAKLINDSVMGDVAVHVVFGLAFAVCFFLVGRRSVAA